jgi:hypothetical protein
MGGVVVAAHANKVTDQGRISPHLFVHVHFADLVDPFVRHFFNQRRHLF